MKALIIVVFNHPTVYRLQSREDFVTVLLRQTGLCWRSLLWMTL